ncbi:MAG: sulfurtransferase [Ectothiorhodospiraceae bacterium]|nr:sulfurtransferase [Ectothiorhodospiraceae bacterium]
MSEWPEHLVEPEWLAEHLEDPRIRIVDCRFGLLDPDVGRQQYAAGHIPGAVHADLAEDLSGPVGPRTGRHPMPDVGQLAARFAAWGIASGDGGEPSYVVAYDDGKLAFAARLWWLLRYVGHTQVAVLNGGWKAWQAQGLPVSTEQPRPAAARFTPEPRLEWVMDYEAVQSELKLPGTRLIDARSPERFQGLQEPIDPVAGTIPGAANAYSDNVVDEQGRMKPAQWLQDYWREVAADEHSVHFCGSGVAACLNLFSQSVAGHLPSRLYVGGWSEWCRRGDGGGGLS